MNFPKTKIGIIGLGFVGTAIRDAHDAVDAELVLIDSDPRKLCGGTYDDLKDAEAVFIAVPSPMGPGGQCDISILEGVLKNLKAVDYDNVIISKVTAVPSEYERLQNEYPNLVHIPEFLTAANATIEYSGETDAIIGGKITAYQREAQRIITLGQRNIKNVALCSIGEAALAKYIINTFLATKVVFMNEMYQLAQSCGYDWRKMRLLIDIDNERIGHSHTRVPGPDGMFGFGGMCFPKDVAALLHFANEKNVAMNILEMAAKKNTLLRLTEPPK